jgi:hypothetical protein
MSPFRIGCVLALAVCIAGCATRAPTTTSEVATARRAALVAPERAADAVMIGESTRADVIAALGKALTLRFDSGYEVWVYRHGRQRNARDATAAEFVILFAPSGVVEKTRFRPAPPRG